MVVEEIHRHRLECARRRRDLIENVNAVLIVVNHSFKTPDLTSNSLESLLDTGLLVYVCGLDHGASLLPCHYTP